MEGCLACDLAEGRRDLPGGVILEEGGWIVEHCVGPLGVGTLIVKTRRHVAHVWELEEEEAAELGPLLRRVSSVLARLTNADQVYICVWAHGADEPHHIHFVVQPVTRALIEEIGERGPSLQSAMFQRAVYPPRHELERFADRARSELPA